MLNFEHLNILWATIGHSSQKLWLMELGWHYLVDFQACRYIMDLNWTSKSKVMVARICPSFPYQILSVSIYYGPQLDIQVKSYDRLNLGGAPF